MTTLKELRDTLLSISHPERLLKLADEYLSRFEEMGDSFILPAEHAIVKPVLEFYKGDLDGWVKFVKGTRDKLNKQSDEFRAIQDFYKVLNVRAIQRRTRAVIDVATEVALKKGLIEDNWMAKQHYARRCVQAWKLRKDFMQDEVRRTAPKGRISVDHREALLKDFWAMIAEEVNNGEVPKP